jgi:hypothetical protein
MPTYLHVARGNTDKTKRHIIVLSTAQEISLGKMEREIVSTLAD